MRYEVIMIEKAKWIKAPNGSEAVCVEFSRNLCETAPCRATAYVSAFGMYRLIVNGETVGDYVFTPGLTSYDFRIQYQTYDITDKIVCGKNVFAAHIGNGFYNDNAEQKNSLYHAKAGVRQADRASRRIL